MPRRILPLTDAKIKTAKPKNADGPVLAGVCSACSKAYGSVAKMVPTVSGILPLGRRVLSLPTS